MGEQRLEFFWGCIGQTLQEFGISQRVAQEVGFKLRLGPGDVIRFFTRLQKAVEPVTIGWQVFVVLA